MEKRVSLKDIAAKAGVSIALVSYVLNNKEGRVGQEMAKKIRKIAAEMNYLPNLVARSLQSGKTNTIGLIVADISNSFFSAIARIIEREAEQFGYTVIFGSTDENAEKSKLLIEAFLNRQVDGLIIAPAAATEDQLRMLKKRKIPFVLIDRFFASVKANSVRINNFESAYQGTAHLVKSGRENIAFLTYDDTRMNHFAQRNAGYRAALKDNKKTAHLFTVAYQQMEKEMKAVIKKLLAPASKIDAVFFATHSLAIEGLKEINRQEIEVPQQLAVLSFDENNAFDLYHSPVSFIRQPLASIGKEAVKLLVENINKPLSKQIVVELETELVIRESSKAVKHKRAV